MQYVHVKNIDKYHPGYKDRTLQWAKIYINMAEGDPDTEMIENEIDWARFIKLILLELRSKKPLPNTDAYWMRKGFDVKVRPMALTIQMLHNFLDIVTETEETVTNPLRRVDKSRVDKEEEGVGLAASEFLEYFNLVTGKRLTLTAARAKLVASRLKTHTMEQLKTAVDNFAKDDWPDRQKYMDVIYCIGIRSGVDNLDKWLNAIPKIAGLIRRDPRLKGVNEA